MQSISQIAVSIPTDLELIEIRDKRGNVLVLREPIALDFALMDELDKNENLSNQQKVFQLALRLAVTFNGEKGVTLANICTLDRFGYKEMMNIILAFQMDTIPDKAEGLIQKYLSDQQ